MEFIPGDTLESLWSNLTESNKTTIMKKLRSFFEQIRSLPSPGFYGNVSGGCLPYQARFVYYFCTRRASPPVPKTGSHLSSCLLGAQNGLSSHFGSLPGSYLRAAYALSQSKMTFRSIHEPSRRVISKDQVLESYVAHAKGTVSICHGHTKR